MKVHRIELPTPFPVGPVNAYLIEGDPLTLVDAGPKTPEVQAALEAGIGATGRRIEDIRRVILTHGHVDHFGNAMWVTGRSGAELFAHPADGPKFAGERWVAENLGKHFTLAGMPPTFLDAFIDRMRAIRALVEYAFETLGAELVRAHASAENAPSIRVAEKVGMRLIERVEYREGDEVWHGVRYEVRR